MEGEAITLGHGIPSAEVLDECAVQSGVIWIYALMAVAMPVHPEDRAELSRFRSARPSQDGWLNTRA